jgi:hypothetical protein
MRFNIIHPSIVDLYINTLALHLLQERLGIVGPDGLTDEMNENADDVAYNFSISVEEAEQLFGSSDLVQEQLNAFTSNMGEA